ncbi:MAG: UDP-N-acetylmuramate:L-alanyl-gamma-D-glutamyl-meso-diaminopimelate ligase, partial [Gammaproteobacteria bacterium]|nr:UDP-N-acetylmuramate:L-alanyl-gamma-D-glutamyl-meso-diaminopimelate ligase [Gammaproteobacteria bacterium]
VLYKRQVLNGEVQGEVSWPLIGDHNVNNALAAIAAARHAGVPTTHAVEGLSHFVNVKRRMEVRGEVGGVTVYDDFAHHPTAITTTLAGLRKQVGQARIIALLEPRSNTMRMGVHQQELAASVAAADAIYLFRPADLDWDLEAVAAEANARVFDDIDALVDEVVGQAGAGDHILVMSNGAFGGIHDKLLHSLRETA